MRLKHLSALCLLLFATALFAAPSEPTVLNALLPNAEIIVAGDKAFEEAPFVKALCQQAFKEMEELFAGEETFMKLLRQSQLEQDNRGETLASFSFGAALAGGEGMPDVSKVEFMLGAQAEKPLNADTQKYFEDACKADNDLICKKTDFRPGWLAYEASPKEKPEFKLLFVFSPDRRQFFYGTAAALKRQLDNPPPLAPYVAQYFNTDRTKGGACTVALLVSDPIKQFVQRLTATAGEEEAGNAMALQLFSSMRAIEFSLVAKEDHLEMRLDGNFTVKEMAGMLKPMLDGILPNAKQMLPLVLGEELPFAQTLTTYAKDTHVGVAGQFGMADFNTICKFIKGQIATMTAHDADTDIVSGDDEGEED